MIAAGLGSRMGNITEDMPKCLLDIGGRTLLDWALDGLREAGCDDILIVTGHAGEKLETRGLPFRRNEDYRNNNILHSVMTARDWIEGPIVASYSDIYVEPWIYRELADAPGDIVMAVDDNWRGYYEGRSNHPIGEAENAMVGSENRITAIGKHLDGTSQDDEWCGEFLGLWKMTEAGWRLFREVFDDVNAKLAETDPFQRAKEWRKSYITDLAQEIVDRGHTVNAAVISKGWVELDTQQDYERLPTLLSSQELRRLEEEGQW